MPTASPAAAVPTAAPATAVPTPPAAIAPAVPATPVPTPAPVAPTAVPTPAGPQIYAVIAAPVVHAGDGIDWDVRTSPDVVGVSAHVASYGFTLQPRGTGHYVLAFQIPANVPFFFHGTYGLAITARDAAGATVTRSVSVRFE